MKAFVFPGQGSQKVGMGESLFDEYSHLSKEADEILGYSIKELCLQDPRGELDQTEFTQPALYVVNALSYLAKINESEQKPDYVAGHSLGEYDALFAARVFDFATGLKLVQKRGALMSSARGGGMAAVIGLKAEAIKAVLKEQGLENIDVANYNSPTQIVISGLKESIEGAQGLFEAAGAQLYIPLKVSGAFHSRYMEPSKAEFEEFLNAFEFAEPEIPVISNVEARPYTQEKVKQLLGGQITHSVKWTESVEYLIQQGVEDFDEVGPGRVLTGLIQKIKRGS